MGPLDPQACVNRYFADRQARLSHENPDAGIENGKKKRLVVLKDDDGNKYLDYRVADRWDRIKAFFGFGPAAFKTVVEYCAVKGVGHRDFAQVISSYNSRHFLPTKKISLVFEITLHRVFELRSIALDYQGAMKEAVNPSDRDYQHILYRAAENGDKELVKALIQHQKPEETFKMTFLHYAARDGKTAAVQAILEMGVAADQKDIQGKTPFMRACEAGEFETAALLLQHGALIEERDTNGHTALYSAFLSKNREAVTWLLQHDADIYTKDTNNQTLFVQALVSEGTVANMITNESRDDWGQTVLTRAVLQGDGKPVQTLLAQGVNIEAKDREEGMTALAISCSEGSTKIAKMLIKAGADVHALDKDGNTPLLLTCYEHDADPEIIKQLLAHGAKLDATNHKGDTALHIACGRDHGNIELIETLLDAGAKLEAKDGQGLTPLFVACSKDKGEVVALLLKRGADRTATTPDGKTLLEFAKENNARNVESFLK